MESRRRRVSRPWKRITDVEHPARKVLAVMERNLTVSMISLPDGVTCDTGGCQ